MKRLVDLSNEEAKTHFMKGSSYFNGDLPRYISFEPILSNVAAIFKGGYYTQFKDSNPNELPNVNYNFIANKDGKFSWRPYELMHPAIYVSLVNVICEETNWASIKARLKEFEGGVVDCCSAPVMSVDHQTDVATQIKSWWQSVETGKAPLFLGAQQLSADFVVGDLWHDHTKPARDQSLHPLRTGDTLR